MVAAVNAPEVGRVEPGDPIAVHDLSVAAGPPEEPDRLVVRGNGLTTALSPDPPNLVV